jgi:hypothetical protein
MSGDNVANAMTAFRLRSAVPAGAALFLATLTFAAPAHAAWVNRNLLRELLGRAPAAPGSQPALDATRLEACLRGARDLDRLGVSLDQQMIVIQDTRSRIAYSRSLEDRPQLPRPDQTEEQMRAEAKHSVAERAEMEKTLDRDSGTYQGQLAKFNDGLKSYKRDCTGSFRKEDLDAAKARLKLQ